MPATRNPSVTQLSPAPMPAPLLAPLLNWYAGHARTLPWRAPPGGGLRPDPWHVLLSEVMLQQTTVAAVTPRYHCFLARYPTVQALAAAPLDDVLGQWAGLGYYARARNLHACARAIADLGYFPDKEAALLLLPGVGDYTAAAIAAFAFHEPTVPLDANLLRVGARLFGVALPPSQARAPVRAALAGLVPPHAPGDFAQALMDLGAAICTVRTPRCLACPIAFACKAHAAGTPEAFPAPAPRKARPVRLGSAWWIESGGDIALVRRPPRGLLGGMLALPGTGWAVGDAEPVPPPIGAPSNAAPLLLEHVFTHFTLRLSLTASRSASRAAHIADQPIIWTPRAELAGAGLPSLYRRAADLLLACRPQDCFEAA